MKIVIIAAHISGVFMMMLLTTITSYHMYARINSTLSRYTNLAERQLNESVNTNDTAVRGSLSNKNGHIRKPTFT